MSDRIDRAGPQPGQSLILLGINHNTAPIAVRERLAIPAGRLADATRSLVAAPGVREALILSTCNRVELLTVHENLSLHENLSKPESSLLSFLDDYFAVPAATLRPHLYEFREREAVRHLFRVASSLDSMVVGEPQILGQVKESYTVARQVGAINGAGGNVLERLLQTAFSVAKKVRSETQIGSSSVSIASVAVDLASRIFGSLTHKHILLVGAGKMSELAVRHLIQHGATSLLIANRTLERAEKIAAQFTSAGAAVEVMPFHALHAHAHRADIVITSTGSESHIFTPEHGRQFLHRRKGRPMFFIDIAVPRDVDPGLNQVDGCFLYDIDDLQQVAQANQADRHREAAAAEQIITAEVTRYQQRLQSLDAVPAILALQQHAEAMRQAELARSAPRLSSLTADQQATVEALTRALTAKFLHPSLTAIKRAAETGDTAELSRLASLYHSLRER